MVPVSPFKRAAPISRHRLAELADVLEQESAVVGQPNWERVVAAGKELVRGGRAQLRRAPRRRG